MTQITCRRCQKTVDRMSHPPFPGEMAVRVQEQVCAPCWKEWLGAQVNLINENRLTMRNPDHRAQLNIQMKAFLDLQD